MHGGGEGEEESAYNERVDLSSSELLDYASKNRDKRKTEKEKRKSAKITHENRTKKGWATHTWDEQTKNTNTQTRRR